MAIPILMPALSPTMTEGNLAKWLKKEGDKIKAGDVIAEIETDKATMEVESADSGVLAKIVIPAKTEGVKVNQLIAVILESGDDKKAVDSVVSKHGTAVETKTEYKSEPAAKVSAAPAPKTQASQITISGSRIIASPLAKRIAESKGMNLTGIKGSGPRGRIIKDDVINAKSGGNFTFGATTQVGRNTEESTIIPNSQMRKVIAKRLTESKSTVPHFYMSADCNIDQLLVLREQINQRANGAFKISVNDFVIKACAVALRNNPKANASWSDEGIIQYNNVDISVAVAIEDGLITPIIQNADQKTLSQISNEMKDLATRAKKNALRPEEFQGGGFSISNLGMYGIKEFSAIINPPQSCILAVGASEKRVVVKQDGTFGAANIMTITISCDHRVVDGAIGAELMQTIKLFLEQPAMMFV